MQKRYFLIIPFLLLSVFAAKAQGPLKGSVFENGTSTRLPDVFIRDNNNRQFTLTDKNGRFEIKAEQGHTLIFDCPGYISDTLFVVDMTTKKIMLEPKTIALREVNITSSRHGVAFDPRKEYPEVYERSKVYILSPSSWFSKEGRDARRLKKYFKREAEERQVDAVFTRTYVGSIVPLKGQELDDFMTMYRPSYAFLRSNNSESVVAYINDSYKKYKKLSPEKRSLPRLSDTTGH
jgi:hypothetical protein